ncbi:hypothetical protein PNA2_1268 [Pyrococcus sp. NA2]|uniref:hypothetical protein n=1 Tax=Pyrococcus sp. (strain NA2) TaxID=342949 RepID=UPI000209ACD0|nr:hypothetical protein [Pyrococcus sp. NA2]AEC52183.1 hypothetical protein PNA2_1268 [Pyrococcus sp. NA2]
MKRVFTIFFFLILMTIMPASSQESRNNIYLTGIVNLELNMTLVNTGDTPKFILINPRYQFQVIRENLSEWSNTIEPDQIYINAPRKNILNYRVGFWIYPHETVKVRLIINESYPLIVSFRDFKSQGCTGEIYVKNGKAFINVPQDYIMPVCEVIFPQLLNYPKYIAPEGAFSWDPSIVLYKYEGIVQFKIIHNSTCEQQIFRDVFAVAPPLLFPNAKVYDFTPHPTMSYLEYIKYLKLTYSPSNLENMNKKFNIDTDTVLYDMKLGLMSTKVKTPTIESVKLKKVDYPIWIIWLGDGSSVEIKYKFMWVRGSG